MLKVLIVDDTQEKIIEIRRVLDEFVDNPDDVPICGCIRDALKLCSLTRFDLVILDLFIPYRAGEDPSPENAKTFLRLIQSDEEYICPVFVIGITRKQEISEYVQLFEAETINVLWYAENDDAWKEKLKNRLSYLLGVKRKLGMVYDYDYDVAIINALQIPEHEVMKEVFSSEWRVLELEDDKTTSFYETTIQNAEGKTIRCVSCYAPQMASVASAALTTKVILRFHPKYLFMTGICAALKGNNIGFGDILVASQVWDGMSGKYIDQSLTEKDLETVFEPDYRQISLNPEFQTIVTRLKNQKEIFARIQNSFVLDKKPDTTLTVHIGPMTSVPAVIASETKIKSLQAHARKLIGLEMESYGVFYAAEHSHKMKPIYTASIKAVSDMADKDKPDKYQNYASYTSASFLKYIIEHELSFSS